MRVVSHEDQQGASDYAMKGFALGIAQWAGVGVFASGLLYAFAPWYRRTQTVNKFYIVMCFGLGGGAYKSDRYMVNYERRGRADMLDTETRKQYDRIYGNNKDVQEESPMVPVAAPAS
ncbi:hypothetical protein BCR42DRAFT_494168 [Absidia repens]|uniref:Uncharacterized protein n=1 Tax=Absidia repens TaxID=90262 RepID=A0A1X2I7L7_9FUNG|nr:hypothetical protein BCR42DRAFT_494168 [Absidia repens]